MVVAVRLRAAVALAGRFPALSGLDLTVLSGEVVAVSGANGAGKTSLLRVCAGLLPLSSGEGEILGYELENDSSEVRRRVGLLGHAAPLYDELTVTENVRFAVRGAGMPTSRVEPALERLGMVGRLAKAKAGRLSAGQRRRVALAVLVARDPDLWLLDEPHAGLDASTRRVVDELVREAALKGSAVLLTSHEQGVVEPLVDRVVELAGGRVSDVRNVKRQGMLSAVRDGGTNVA